MKDHQECLFLKGSVSEAIRELVRGGDVSYRELARRTGVDIASISRFAEGSEIRSSTVDKLADYYGVGVAKRPKKEEPTNDNRPQADSIRVSEEHSVEARPSANDEEAVSAERLHPIDGSSADAPETLGRGPDASSLREDTLDMDEARHRSSGEGGCSG